MKTKLSKTQLNVLRALAEPGAVAVHNYGSTYGPTVHIIGVERCQLPTLNRLSKDGFVIRIGISHFKITPAGREYLAEREGNDAA